jgi:hypothetical protein
MSQSICKVTGYRLDDKGSNPSGGRNFSLDCFIQISSGAHPAFYSVDTGGSFFRDKVP